MLKALAKRPEDRFPTAADFAAALDLVATSELVTTTEPLRAAGSAAPLARAPAPLSVPLVLFGAVLCSAATVLAMLWWLR